MTRKQKVREQIRADMSLGEIAGRWPQVVPIMYKYGLHCPTCPVAASESLRDGARVHGLSDKQLELMLKEMNRAIK